MLLDPYILANILRVCHVRWKQKARETKIYLPEGDRNSEIYTDKLLPETPPPPHTHTLPPLKTKSLFICACDTISQRPALKGCSPEYLTLEGCCQEYFTLEGCSQDQATDPGNPSPLSTHRDTPLQKAARGSGDCPLLHIQAFQIPTPTLASTFSMYIMLI